MYIRHFELLSNIKSSIIVITYFIFICIFFIFLMIKHVNSLILQTYLICELLLTHHYHSMQLVAWQPAYIFGKPINENENMNVKTLTLNIFLWLVDPINTFNCPYKTENEPIRISYHGNVHYNSIVDPFKATIGVGLGLPGLQPGVSPARQAQQRSN